MTRSLMRALALSVCLAGTAQAQFGSILKKAVEKKVENKVEDKVAPAQAGPPLAGDPVTATQLDAVLKGLAVEVSAAAAYEAKHEELLKKQDEWRAAEEAARPDAEANSKARRKFEDCMDPLLRKAEKSSESAIQERMMRLGSDPKSQEFIKQYVALSQQMAEAQQKRDVATMNRLDKEIRKLMGMDPAADSAAAYKVCGRPPAATAAMQRAAALRKESDDMQEAARKLEEGRSARAAAASGLPADVYATARERLLTWNQQKKYKERLSVTKDEDALFSSRIAEIKKVESALR